jgi:hypothetical protein
MKNIKMLPLKIIGTIIGTLLVGVFCYVGYSYGVNVQKSSWQGSFIAVGALGLCFEFLVVWIIFGMDILRNGDF